jgi:hypothetical protein
MLGEREQRHVSRGRYCHKGRMSDMTSVLHQRDTHFQRGRYYSYEGRESNQRFINTKKNQRHVDRGSNPKESSIRGSIPKGRYTLSLI